MNPSPARKPLVIGHRGASGYVPEHTLAAYAVAVDQGADVIEPDVVMTKDGVAVVRHENEIGGTTDVAAHPRFRDRHTTRVVDGMPVTGWFVEDFTLDELKTLRARERLPQLRPRNAGLDGRFDVPALGEVLDFLAALNRGRAAAGQPPVGICPETKHPTYFRERGLPVEPALLRELDRDLGGAAVLIQSFETGNLRTLRRDAPYRLLQLVEAGGGPWDLRTTGRRYDDLLTPAGLDEVATWAMALGAAKERVIARDAAGRLEPAPTSLVARAHDAGLEVIAWTFRAENVFLPADLRSGESPAARGDLEAEIRRHLDAGIDGFFTDQPDAGRSAVDGWRGIPAA